MWRTQWAAVTGRGHQENGLPGQDRAGALTSGGVTAIALSDGSGSQPLSQEGAEIAVQTICRVLCMDFDRLLTAKTPSALRRALLSPVRSALQERADSLGVALDALACTLLAVAVRGSDYLLLHTGDGVIAYQKAGQVRLASGAQNGEFANSTTFVTSPLAMYNSRVLKGQQEQLEGFLLMSDGCERSLYQRRTKRLAPLVGQLFQRAELLEPAVSREQLSAVLRDPIASRTRDDCTVALLTRPSQTFGQWDRLTQREQSRVLGIRTQNKNRRRRKIRRYAKLYGITGATLSKEF